MKAVPKKLKLVVCWSSACAILFGIICGIVGHRSPGVIEGILQRPYYYDSLVLPGICAGIIFGLIVGGIIGLVNPAPEHHEHAVRRHQCATCGRSDVTLTPCMSCGLYFCDSHGTHCAGKFACPSCLAGASRRMRDAMKG